MDPNIILMDANMMSIQLVSRRTVTTNVIQIASNHTMGPSVTDKKRHWTWLRCQKNFGH